MTKNTTMTLTLDAEKCGKLLAEIESIRDKIWNEEACARTKEDFDARKSIRTVLYNQEYMAYRKFFEFIAYNEYENNEPNLYVPD